MNLKSIWILLLVFLPHLASCAEKSPATAVAGAEDRDGRRSEQGQVQPAPQASGAARKGTPRGKDPNCVRVEWQTRNVASFGGPMQMVRVPVCIKAKSGARS